MKKPILGKLYACGMKKLLDESSEILSGKHKVFLNGEWVGVCDDSITLVTALRNKRRRGKLPHQVLFITPLSCNLFNQLLKNMFCLFIFIYQSFYAHNS